MEIPSTFTLLPTPLPPMLLQMAGATVESRFISLCYYGTKATWSDGRSGGTFSFYQCYKPLIDHLAIAIYLFDCHLGSDDEYPTHALLCDRAESKLYVGPWKGVEPFLEAQHPPVQPMTPEEWEAVKAECANALNLDTWEQTHISPEQAEEMQRLGMFEAFPWALGTNPKMQQEAAELAQWLDQYIDDALVKKYLEAAKAGNWQAILVLEDFKRRCDATIAHRKGDMK